MMQTVIVLGDFAERDTGTGKVHILGAGWSVTGPGPAPQAVVLFVRVPAGRVHEPIPVTLRLVDAAGKVVAVPGAAGIQRLEISGQIEMNEPEEWEGSHDLDAVFSVNIAALSLQPGSTYSWRVDVDGKETASTEFRVRPEPPSELSGSG